MRDNDTGLTPHVPRHVRHVPRRARPAKVARCADRHLLGAAGFGALVMVGIGLSAWEGTVVQSSHTAHWSVLAVLAVAVLTALVAGWGHQREPSGQWLRRGTSTAWGDLTGRGRRAPALLVGSVVWVVLICATIGWDLNSFVHQAHDLPTLSRLVGDVTRHQWGRALVFALWLALGAYLMVGGRTPPAAATPGDPAP